MNNFMRKFDVSSAAVSDRLSPTEEASRLHTLHRYRILDTLPEQTYQDITELASFITGTPISLVSLVDEDRQWFKAERGLGVRETPRSQSFCAHTLGDAKTLIVEDALNDDRFQRNPLVLGDPHIRFYAGAPIVTGTGQVLGTVCVIDTEPRKLEPQQISALEALARQAMAMLEQHRSSIAQGELTELLRMEMTEQQRLERQVTALNRLQGFLLKLADRQRLYKDPRSIMEMASQAVGEHLNACRVGFAEMLEDGATLKMETGWACPPFDVLTGNMPVASFGEGNAADLNRGVTLVYRDVRLDARADAQKYEALGVRAAIVVPLIRGSQWRGTFYVNHPEPRDWSTSEVEVVQEVAERMIDVLERAQTEEVLRRSESQFKLAVEAAGLASWFYDPSRGIVGGDAKMARLFGLEVPEGPAEMWLAPIVDADRERVTREFAAAVAGAPYDTEYRIAQAGGALCWVRAKAQMLTEDGVSRLVGICEDITRRKVVEEDLRATAERLSLAQQAGKLAVWQWEMPTGKMTWSGGSGYTFGRAPEEMEHVDQVFQCLHEDDRERVTSDLQPAIQGTGPYYSEFRVVWPDESIHWLQGFGKTIFSADGKPALVAGINLDITERKKSEQALIRNEKLAAVGRLASSIAHEINNPLESVTNLLYLCSHSDDLTQVRQYLRIADDELRRASAIANQTLRFHKQATRPTEVTAAELINGCLVTYNSRLANSSIQVQKRIGTTQPVLCFEGEIRQVINNLVGNAIDAMPKGGRLLMRSREGHDWKTGRAGLVLTVADTGTGMSKQTLEKVFEAFFTTKGIGGTGLGLWITKEILDRHKGKLTAKSREIPGKSGTVFLMFLPFDAVGR